MICPLSPAHFTVLGALQVSLALLFFAPQYAVLPLVLVVTGCFLAPLFPRFPFYLPIVTAGDHPSGVALTFDDGPDPAVTPRLLDLLAARGLTATFFVTGENAEKHPELVREILAAGHTIGNHTFRHDPLVMLKGKQRLKEEVERTQDVLRRFGVQTLAFRPPAGATNPHLWRILLEAGMFCVNFSCRAGDMGNRRIGRLAERILSRVRPGRIILLHDVTPHRASVETLLAEFEAVFDGLSDRGLEVLPLAALIRKEVMRPAGEAPPDAAQVFYDDLAADYDREQFCSSVSIARRKEVELFTARFPDIFSGTGRVLEIGAGTGIFTLKLAEASGEVLAVDISARMLEVLERKARERGCRNITTLAADIEATPLPGKFDVVCSFSALEYLNDLPALCRRLSAQVEPGGRIYFVCAHRSFFRLFTRIGNAMRQGIWLKAYGKKEMSLMLRQAGFEPVSLTSHLFRSPLSGGMILEVVAIRTGAAAAGCESSCRKAA